MSYQPGYEVELKITVIIYLNTQRWYSFTKELIILDMEMLVLKTWLLRFSNEYSLKKHDSWQLFMLEKAWCIYVSI